MSTKPGTSINIDSDVGKRFPSTGTGARKFSAADLSSEQENRNVDVVSNAEHLIDQASSLKGVAMVAEEIAAAARLDLTNTRVQIEETPGQLLGDSRVQLANFSDADLANYRDTLATDLVRNMQPSVLDQRKISDDLYQLLPGFVFNKRTQIVSPKSYNPAVPSLDNVTVEMSKQKGTVDCFFTTLKFSLQISHVWDGKVKAIRIFRSTIVNPKFQRGEQPTISLHGMEKLATSKMRSRIKAGDFLGSIEHRFREAGVLNAISVLNPVDPETNRRISTNDSDTGIEPLQNSAGKQAISTNTSIDSFLDGKKFSNIDSGVAQDLNVIRNLRNQDAQGSIQSVAEEIVLNVFTTQKQGLLNRTQLRDIKFNPVASLVIDSNNSAEFREIAFVALDKLNSTVIGDHVEYSFNDESAGYGKGYKYYVMSINNDMIESVRSRIVDITIEGIRIPERPKNVYAYNIQGAISMNIIVGDQLVEKFEIFRKSEDTSAIRNTKLLSYDMGSTKGFNSSISVSKMLVNKYIKIGEALNGTRQTGATFYDRRVMPGSRYSYRVYSVDVFGNKSESPFEFDMFLPEQKKPNELLKPSVTAEVDSQTNKAKVSFRCNDKRVTGLFLARKDLTTGQNAFTTPGQVNSLKFGAPTAGHTSVQFEDTILRGGINESVWTGFFENRSSEIIFVDKTTSLDHTYQYRVYGTDKFGNSTSYATSSPLMITRHPLIDAPVNVTAEVVQGPQFTVGGIKLSWQDGNVDVSSEDSLGNRKSLSDSSVRTLYQVERRRVGEERWDQFPMVEDKQFFDPAPSIAIPGAVSDIQGVSRPRFRPPFIETNQSYVYRVKAYQTGSYESNYGSFVEVFAALPISTPENFRLRSSDTKVSPYYVALNWDTTNDSAVVDKWIIERAEVNNFAANSLNIKNPRDFSSLNFQQFRTVFHEASRFQSTALDNVRQENIALSEFKLPSTIFTGDHQFQDTNVSFGNTYFYRIKAVGLAGAESSWSYRGMKLTEESYERNIATLIDDATKGKLIKSLAPIRLTLPVKNMGGSSFGFQPTFSKQTSSAYVNPPGTTTIGQTKPTQQPTYNSSATAMNFMQQRSLVFGKK